MTVAEEIQYEVRSPYMRIEITKLAADLWLPLGCRLANDQARSAWWNICLRDAQEHLCGRSR